MRMLIVTLSAALMLLSIVPQAGAAKSHLKCGGEQLAMRQLGEGVQSEERQMLLPFLRGHLSLRPAAASGHGCSGAGHPTGGPSGAADLAASLRSPRSAARRA